MSFYQKKKKKGAGELNNIFSKESIRVATRHVRRYSASLTIGEAQIEPTGRRHHTPVGMAVVSQRVCCTTPEWSGCSAL